MFCDTTIIECWKSCCNKKRIWHPNNLFFCSSSTMHDTSRPYEKVSKLFSYTIKELITRIERCRNRLFTIMITTKILQYTHYQYLQGICKLIAKTINNICICHVTNCVSKEQFQHYSCLSSYVCRLMSTIVKTSYSLICFFIRCLIMNKIKCLFLYLFYFFSLNTYVIDHNQIS